jgi:transmembrane protein EpsG
MIWIFVSFLAWVKVLFYRTSFTSSFYVILVLLTAFRYFVGSDYWAYAHLFDDSVLGKEVNVEFSYFLISRVLGEVGLNMQALIFFYAISTYLFIYKGLKEISINKEFLGVTLFLVYVIFYFPSMSIVRQGLAASIAFWGVYKFLKNEEWLKFLIVLAVAFFFHKSSIVYILCIPLYLFKPSKFFYIVSTLFALILGLTVFGYMVGLIANLTGFGYKGYYLGSTPMPQTIFLINTIVLFFIFLLSLKYSNKEDYFIVNIVWLILIFRLLAIDFLPINRLGAAFSLFIPVYLYVVFYNHMKKQSKLFFLISFLPLMFVSDTFRLNKDYSYYQYSFNVCLYGDPCPVFIVGDRSVEELFISEINR